MSFLQIKHRDSSDIFIWSRSRRQGKVTTVTLDRSDDRPGFAADRALDCSGGRPIDYTENHQFDYSEGRPIATGDLIGLYKSVGWSNYTRNPDLLERAVANSLWKMGAWDGGELVGLIRAVGDDASIAYVQDILVRPDRQRLGIGTRLFAAALERFAHVRQLVLITDDEEKTASFYRSTGMADLGELGVRAFARFSSQTH